MKSRPLSRSAVVLFGAFVLCSETLAKEKEAQPDIKPALAKDGFDKEQMRLARVIHKRVVDYHAIKIQTNGGKDKGLIPYKETLRSLAQFEMVPIKGGTFTWRGEKEDDVLEVTISPFWMGKHEVTWEQYEPFTDSALPRLHNGNLPDDIREQVINDLDLLARPTQPYIPLSFGMPKKGHPALAMTQHAANKYCQWISYQTGHFYRLPTEAEWEYACRAGQADNSSWGEDPAKAHEYAWFGGGPESHYHKPGLKKPNGWGMHDMHGNVLEWTLDQHVPNRKEFFGKDKVIDPWIKATKPYPHVVKGGHWKQNLKQLAASARGQSNPAWKVGCPMAPKNLWYHDTTPWLGMRLVRPQKIPTAAEMYHYWNSGVEYDK